MYKTREEWFKEAVKLVNTKIFNNKLDLIDYQISAALLSGRKLGEVVFPYEGDDVGMDDFFPPTIHIDEKIKDTWELIAVLAHECIHCFMNIKNHGKRFKKEAKDIGFEAPFTCSNPNDYLKDKCKEIASTLGEYPGKPVIPHKKEHKKREFSGRLFCPDCGYELRVSEKMYKEHGEGLPTCPCGCKMGLSIGEEEKGETEK